MKRLALSICFVMLCVGLALGETQTAAVTAENNWTSAITPRYFSRSASSPTHIGHSKDLDYGTLELTISGTWEGTVTLQVAYDYGASWLPCETYTSNTTKIITFYQPGASFRAGIGTGDYTSGTCNIRLSK